MIKKLREKFLKRLYDQKEKQAGTKKELNSSEIKHSRINLDASREFMKKYKKALLLLIILLLVLTSSRLQEITVVTLAITIGALSRAWRRVFPLEMGFELVLLLSVVTGIAYGSWVGALVGVISLAISVVLSGENPMKMMFPLVNIFLVGYLAPVIYMNVIADIFIVGLALTLLYDLLGFIFWVWTGSNIIKIVLFLITHIIWNIFVFWKIAPVVLAWIV